MSLTLCQFYAKAEAEPIAPSSKASPGWIDPGSGKSEIEGKCLNSKVLYHIPTSGLELVAHTTALQLYLVKYLECTHLS